MGLRAWVCVAVITVSSLATGACDSPSTTSASADDPSAHRVLTSGDVTVLVAPAAGHGDDEKTYVIDGANDRGCVIGTVPTPAGDFDGVFAGNPGTKITGDRADFTIVFAKGSRAAAGDEFVGGGYAVAAGEDNSAVEQQALDTAKQQCGEELVIVVE